jgi:hypothetical protein
MTDNVRGRVAGMAGASASTSGALIQTKARVTGTATSDHARLDERRLAFRTPIYVVHALVRAANEDGRTITSLLNKIIMDWLVQKKFLKAGDPER